MRVRPSLVAAAALAFFVPVLYTASLAVPSWSGRFIALLPLAAAAPALTVGLVWRQRSLDLFGATGFLLWAGLATALASVPSLALWGLFGLGTGLVFVAALVGSYGLGRLASERGVVIERALLLSLGLNAVVALAQVVFDLSRANFELYVGRATGLMGNPVFLGVLLAGGFWLAIHHVFGHGALNVAAGALMAAGVNVSGSRIALFAVVAAVALSIVKGWRHLLMALAAGLIGVAIGTGAFAIRDTAGGDQAAVQRLSSTSGVEARTSAWTYAAEAVVDEPIVGSGPGRFKEATVARRTLEFLRAEGPNTYYGDAHNIVVEYLVTTGVPGGLALLLWVAAAFRRSSLRGNALTGFAALLLLGSLLEPQHNGVTPLAFLALGAAAGVGVWAAPRWAAVALAVTAAVGAGAAVNFALGFWWLEQARLDFRLDDAIRADERLPRWPIAKEQLARVYLLQSLEQRRPEIREQTVRYRLLAAQEDPWNPAAWVTLADFEMQLEDRAAATTHFEAALVYDPWRTQALNARGRLAAENGDTDLALRLLRRSLVVDPRQAGVRGLVAAIESGELES